MNFNSPAFFIFFPVVFILYYVFSPPKRWIILIISGIFFYGYGNPLMLYVPFSIIILTYYAGILIEKSKHGQIIFIAGIVIIILILVIYKYADYIVNNVITLLKIQPVNLNSKPFGIIVPLGISYITFQAGGYLIEIYRGNQVAEKHIHLFAAYLLFFPKLLAGPVERAHNFIPQLKKDIKFDYNNIIHGIRLFTWGLIKKIVIADRLAILVDQVYNNPERFHGFSIIIASIFFTFQLYADFSGYTDMALGISKMLGFDLTNNFKNPFLSKSTTELWRRWHITLSTWFADYLFKPLSLSLRNFRRTGMVFSIMVTFILLGIWHGAGLGFLFFGAIQGLLLSFEFLSQNLRSKLRKKIPRLINKIIGLSYTFIFFTFALIFLRSMNFLKSKSIISGLFTGFREQINNFSSGMSFTNSLNILFTKQNWIISLFAIIVLFIEQLISRDRHFLLKLAEKRIWLRWSVYAVFIYVLINFSVFDFNEFIYFKF